MPVKRTVLMMSALLVMAVFLAACGPRDPKAIVSKELGLDVSGAAELSHFDTHGGFHGDGTAFIVLEFSDDTVLKQIQDSTQWKPFPLDDTVKTLIYGTQDTAGGVGPYVCDGEGNALVPEIQDGYYRLIDRHAEAGGEDDILHRGSFNFTLGAYDAVTNTLYFCELDT